jgi:hypothetical protein
MGYETKLIIGVKREDYGHKKPSWFDVYAEIDLCKCGYGSHISALNQNSDKTKPEVYWYGYDGNTEFTKDRYDSCPKPVALRHVVHALKADCENEDYRRFKWALALLESMEADNENENIEVLFFGS